MDITNFIRNGVTYPIGDTKSRESIATAFDSTAFYSAGDYVMYDGTLYKFTSSHSGDWDSTHAEATCVTDELGSGGGSGGNAQVMYYYEQPVNTATDAEIFRIKNSKINTDTVVLECTFADPSYITSDVIWTSYEGYIAFTGTCTTATTANVTMAYKSDDIVTTVGLDLLYEGNPTANTDTSLITGKKFSDYKSLFVEADGGSINRFATAMSVAAFSASSSTNWWFGDPRMSGTSYYCLIRYTSDTQFQIREKGSALTYFKIYGDSKYSKIQSQETYTEYTLTKESTATNWTILRYHACKQGNTAFIQLVISVTASQDGSTLTVIKLPMDLYPKYEFETRGTSGEYKADINLSVKTNGEITINRQPASVATNARLNLCYPTA